MTNRRGAMLRRDIAPEDELAMARALAPLVDELWIVEDLPFAGGLAQLGPVLAATEATGTVIGHGIAPAPFRHPVALAMEWAALARMYPGRLQAGIGHGVPSWMEQLGRRVGSPLTLLEETMTAVRQLLAGATVDVEGRYVTARDVTLEFPPAEVPPVSSGVTGPKSLALSARVADGTILPEGQSPDDVARLRALVDADPGPADPPPAEGRHRLTVFTGFYCGDLRELPPPPEHLPPGWAAVGPTPEAVAAELTALVDAGADAIVLVPFADDQVGQLELAAAEIWPLVGR
jgi:alkanesulfonate monooxygenase SsuD/methylene tetrahydromethanopterin reductase-like flavin-dependent oxidoreductase (luciferase family)